MGPPHRSGRERSQPRGRHRQEALASSIHPAFHDLPRKDLQAETVTALSEGKRRRALAKLRAVHDFKAYCRSGEGRSMGKTEARQRFVERRRRHYEYRAGGKVRTLPLSVGSLKRWERHYRNGGADALARDGRGGGREPELTQDAVEMYWHLRNLPRKLTIASCFRAVAKESHNNGWSWFEKLRTCQAWDQRVRDARALVLNREGAQAYTQKAGPYVELDPDSFEPGEAWVGDEKTFDVWVRTPRGSVVRPVLCAWHDWRSRTIVGWRIVETGNEDALVASFAEGADAFGLPAYCIIDNGRDYSSYAWKGSTPKRVVSRRKGDRSERLDGLFALCGIQASYCLPYNPNGKARLERWFKTLDDQLCRALPSWCGNSPDDRPEAHARLVTKAVEWSTFVDIVARYIQVYNARPHTGEGMEGRTPLQVMKLAPRKRVVDDNIRRLLLAKWHKPVKLGRNGVAIRVGGAPMRYGQYEPKLLALATGTMLRVCYDPDDVSTVDVWTMDGKFLCSTPSNKRLNRKVASEDLRYGLKQQRRAMRRMQEASKVGLDHLRDPADLAVAALAHDSDKHRLPDPDGDGTNLVPVQPPIEVPARRMQPLRQAVGAETTGVEERLRAFNRRTDTGPGKTTESVWSRLRALEGQD